MEIVDTQFWRVCIVCFAICYGFMILVLDWLMLRLRAKNHHGKCGWQNGNGLNELISLLRLATNTISVFIEMVSERGSEFEIVLIFSHEHKTTTTMTTTPPSIFTRLNFIDDIKLNENNHQKKFM